MIATTRISLPALGISARNSVHIWTMLRDEYDTNAYAITRGYWAGLTLYDSAGLAWSVAEVTPGLSSLSRFLARTVYNPKMKVRIGFHEPRPYSLDLVKTQLIDLVDLDDDLLTQFIEPDDLERRIRATGSFGDLLGELRKLRVIEEQ